MKIIIETKEPGQMRYPTAGDWYHDKDGVLKVDVVNTGLATNNLLIAIHELIEFTLCRAHGITQQRVDEFDKTYENLEEPGDSKLAPYEREHSVATGIERILAAACNVSWEDHEALITQVDPRQKPPVVFGKPIEAE